MGIIRFLVIAGLIWFAWRTMNNWLKERNRSLEKDGKPPLQADEFSDILEEDPVCGKLVPRSQAVRLDVDGRVLYFCSKECCQIFRKEKGEKS
ncbi:YHS domain-containing protein [Desulforhopalus vacuolatus]|uniref:YHS domain-containing protein n=1 Tax=Desulforhopalus vacuolatus TaxID=40414 RepID=UPI0019641280|nr:YHS domain-containing protein [Desulforhopalus vacuolatus]MBM9520218.1 YHS domain-containing protein [Desulforhopalus vacuolatus]